ncbi:MAG: SSS family solute:Na+ symporter [Verrucomicrobiales bacterium]|jgi:SSS family solute:Na+ symporter
MADKPIAQLFTLVDWGVLIGYLVFCTALGHRMRGQQASIRDFFLGGKTLPWQAVSGSIIATELSGVTFIGVPAGLFAMEGNFTYLQWAIGSIMARIIVGYWFVKVYYEREIYSSYDYMGNRLGKGAKTLATILFFIGSILAQSVRVLVAALPLKVVTGLPLGWCIVIIGLFAIGWTLMGGMRTVIWTDVMQFFLFTIGGIIALGYVIFSLPGGFGELWSTATDFNRTTTFDWTFGLRAELEFTMWVALLAVPFQNLTMFGVDQLCAQRIFCCGSPEAARKAIVFSSFGQVITFLMLMVGAALFVHYQNHPFNEFEAAVVFPATEEATSMQQMAEAPLVTSGEKVSNVRVPTDGDAVFPMWIVSILPMGLSGLLLAGVFAAAISSLDSILAALSQTTLSLIYHPERDDGVSADDPSLVKKSRFLVVGWGIILTGFTMMMLSVRKDIPILPLAFGMTSYTVGPMLAIFLVAMIGKGSVRGLVIGTVLSFLIVMFVRTDVWVLFGKGNTELFESLGNLPTYEYKDGSLKSVYAFVWTWPLTTILTLLCGVLIPSSQKKSA